jgi:myosin heavy subunit
MVQIPFDFNHAVLNRDALAKVVIMFDSFNVANNQAVYANLFDWLVKRLNTQLGQPNDENPFVGVLDIYGFEIFQNNR